MKILIVVGTRPELIRLSCVIQFLDRYCKLAVMHTGQNFDQNLRDIFYSDLGLRGPDYQCEARGSFGAQVGTIFEETEKVISDFNPDRFLVLGDTNSALTALVAKRRGIPVFHMEAGNRCFDDRVPEEVNRRIIDHSSDILLPYTERSRAYLLREGIKPDCIFVTGNPINEVLIKHQAKIEQSTILDQLGLAPQSYFLSTVHRAENVDIPERLENIIKTFEMLVQDYDIPVIVSLHPRLEQRLAQLKSAFNREKIRLLPPFCFSDFVHLEKSARCVLTDSGTVQEECSIFRIPVVTLRDVTERPETIEAGLNCISGVTPSTIVKLVEMSMASIGLQQPPPEYVVQNVSETVGKIVLGHYRPRN